MPATQWTHSDILQALKPIVAECVGVDEDDVTPEANFRFDLDGESIDDLDLSFRCERAFGINRPLAPLMDLGRVLLESQGQVESSAVQQFLSQQPVLREAVSSLGKTQLDKVDLESIYTIELVARLIEQSWGAPA
ncbi:hypothetical protein GC163_19350 [bacterium]|nr:hypothetical protein [bacterium]